MVTIGAGHGSALEKPVRPWNGVALGIEMAAASAGAVAVLCGAIAIASWRAVVRTGNPRIQFVVAAFALLAAKNLVKCIVLASRTDESAALELAFSLGDLAAVALIAWPLLASPGPGGG
jgi:hypothetical protein